MKPHKAKGRTRIFWERLVELWKFEPEPKQTPSIGNYARDEFLYREDGREMIIAASFYDAWYVDDSPGYENEFAMTILVDSIRRWRAPHDRERVSEAEQQRILQSFCRLLEAKKVTWKLSMEKDYHHPDEDRFYSNDWGAETQKIRLAFGIKKRCEFVAKEVSWDARREMDFVRLPNGQQLSVSYAFGFRSFRLYEKHTKRRLQTTADAAINWDGQTVGQPEIKGPADALAQGLYNLGLLGPELEAAFGVTAHQKLEWALEYEARTKPK